jgi:hypothetical protein
VSGESIGAVDDFLEGKVRRNVLTDWLWNRPPQALADQHDATVFSLTLMNSPVVTQVIVDFLRQIGLPVRAATISETTTLPGMNVDQGVLIFDPEKLKHPGDLLHEAGHLAVKPPTERLRATSDMGSDPAEEMMAIAWSYAAVLHLGLPPETVFHAEGYRGGSNSLLENFCEGRYLAVPMLQWIGLTHDEANAKRLGTAPYPKMLRWLREG